MRSELNTPTKYEAHRLNWLRALEGTQGGRFCRMPQLPYARAMAFDKQPATAANEHKSMAKDGTTCIDCHKGLAHMLPQAATRRFVIGS